MRAAHELLALCVGGKVRTAYWQRSLVQQRYGHAGATAADRGVTCCLVCIAPSAPVPHHLHLAHTAGQLPQQWVQTPPSVLQVVTDVDQQAVHLGTCMLSLWLHSVAFFSLAGCGTTATGLDPRQQTPATSGKHCLCQALGVETKHMSYKEDVRLFVPTWYSQKLEQISVGNRE